METCGKTVFKEGNEILKRALIDTLIKRKIY